MAPCTPCKRKKRAKLRHRVTIETPAATLTPDGHSTGWSVVGSIFANVRPMRGKEIFYQEQASEAITHKVEIRYRPDISARNRLIFEDRVLNIVSTLNVDERNDMIELTCAEKFS